MGSALSVCKVGRQNKEEEDIEQTVPEHTTPAARPPAATPPAASAPAASAPAGPPPVADDSSALGQSFPVGRASQLTRGGDSEEDQRSGREDQYDDGSAGPHGLREESHRDSAEDFEQQARMQMAAEMAAEIDRLNMEVEHLGQQIESMQAKKEALMAPQEVQDSSEEELLWFRSEIAELEASIQSRVDLNAQLNHGCAEAEQQIAAFRTQAAEAGQSPGEGRLQDLLAANEHLMALSQESEAASARNEDWLRLFKQEHAEHEELEAQIESLEADILPLLKHPPQPPADEHFVHLVRAERPDLDRLRAETARMLEENADLAAQRRELEQMLEGIAPVSGVKSGRQDAGPRQEEPESSQGKMELEAVKAELQRLREENVELSKLRGTLPPQRLESVQTLSATPPRLDSGQAFMPSPQVVVHSSIGTIQTRGAPQAAETERKKPLCTTRVIQAPSQCFRGPQSTVPAPQLLANTLHWPQNLGANPASQLGTSPLCALAPVYRSGGGLANVTAVPTAFVR